MRKLLVATALALPSLAVLSADAVVTPGTIERVGLYGGPAILVHRTLTTHANETSGGWHYHPGYVYNVVKSGTIAVQDGCDAQPTLYKAGQAFETSEGRVHRAFVPKEAGKDAGKEDAVEENMFILPPGYLNAEGKPLLSRNVAETMGHCGPPGALEECRNGGWRKFDFPQRFDGEGACAASVAARPGVSLLIPGDPLK